MSTNNKRVLIVDDSKVSRMLARAYIEEKYPGWEILEAGNGQEALSIAADLSLDLVMMDVNMPGISGLEAAEQIKASQPAATITMLTANVQNSVRQRAEAISVHFLEKPITAATIQQALALIGA
ncbi:response regulator [Parachitinimonas caeni]|uniref:Response regulator n=1 Tax=Parachitinimonas caeni TaxID=3031301 RepID=A0ABT7DRZ1_9NEIS|nr:response regulator [Parachitinimonas caeni]MDK2122842.1 response regulator [Parachitinimonas caeni]